ncbi:CapA family protein [Streptosporangium sp. CA-135522]|uniref:CapA family protein n=1 Tax=Streptosporangium sp. CA-135522 TaxID=3240072 RepID=UPI003D93E202
MATEASIFAVGDVFIDRDEPQTAFQSSKAFLTAGDVLFGNCEGAFSDVWERAPSSGSPVVAPAANAEPLAEAGFTVVSLANNHSVDGGHGALLNTCGTLESLGIRPVGAGADIAQARRPVVVTRGDLRIAFVAYASVFPYGYEARAAVPGLAPLRAHTRFTPWELNEWQPGLLPRVTTELLAQDETALHDDLKAAREQADIVVASFHWGDFTRPYVLTDHERRVARLAVDAGADIVLGHHHHMLRGVEFYRNRPIFYGLGHYLFDLPRLRERLAKDGYLSATGPHDELALSRRFGEYRIQPREGYPLLPFHEDSRLTGIAVVRVGAGGVTAVGFRPAVINQDNDPIHALPGSPEWKNVVTYLERCCAEEGIATRFVTPEKGSGLPEDCVQILPGG